MSGLLGLLCLGGMLALAPGSPRCTVDGTTLAVDGLPALLEDEEVSRHLRSGLTTTIEIRIEARSGRARVRTTSRVQVRYEPWEEVYLVLEEDGDEPRSSTGDELLAWWRDLELQLTLPSSGAGQDWRATLAVDVVPFSESEREDARRWLARSGGRASDSVAAGSGGEVGSLLELVMATGIDRRSVAGDTWRLECLRGAP